MGKRGPQRQLFERIDAWFAAGTMQRIDNVIDSKESRLAFVRQAVDAELNRRETVLKISQPQRRPKAG